MGFVAGYIASITVNGTSLEDFTSSATRSAPRDALDKTKLGQDRRTYTTGLGDATIDVQMHMDTTVAAALEAAYEATVPVAYVFRAGAPGTTDLGQYSGTAIVTDFSIVGDADGEWDSSFALQGTGDYVYTAPV